MRIYEVSGMSCAVCAGKVEKAVSEVSGVESCSVNLLTGKLSLTGNASDEQIITAIENAGYGVKMPKPANFAGEITKKTDEETKNLIVRLVSSCVLVVMLMYVSMGVVMWGFPFIPALHNPVAIALIELLITLVVVALNRKFFISGAKSVIHGSPNMDTLVALGSGASILYSLVITFVIAYDTSNGNLAGAHAHLHGLYYESGAMILTLITVGKTLESFAKGKTTSAISALMSLTPKTATVIRDGVEQVIAVEELRVGDETVIRAGGKFSCDGIIVNGLGSVDESALTGESIPVDKAVGDRVSTATTLVSGYLVVKAEKVGEETTISEIIKTVENANATKAPIAKLADKVSSVFVPVVMAIALIVTVVWLIISGGDIGFSLGRGISVLVISCPCALGLATPVAIMVGSGVGAKNGVLFKSAESLETAGRIKTVALDKTGTLTQGKPFVTDIVAFNEDEKEFIDLAYSLEKYSEHPLAKAIVEEFADRASAIEIEDFATLSGNGVSAKINGATVYGGSVRFTRSLMDISEEMEKKAEELSSDGKTVTVFARDSKVVGFIALADREKTDAVEAIAELKVLGVETVMITGDSQPVAKAVCKKVGIDRYFASVLPVDKEKIVNELKTSAKTAMVGDGINDAPALTSADLGVAIGAGAEIAISSAQVVLPGDKLWGLVNTIKIGRNTLKNIKQNLFWAFFYNALAIPVASGAFVSLGFTLNPMLGALTMSLSSFCVVTNALRLNFYKSKNSDKKQKKEIKTMEFTLKVEGMMCPHCEARVKQTVEGIVGVKTVVVDYKKGTVVFSADSDITATVKSAIENQGYKVL
ncbi:MAG: heavy metal translocating P-type ATPase [Clostridia bacterium]|nr:heavy metal translocating P-type ATPase [Clostridia bacterium]